MSLLDTASPAELAPGSSTEEEQAPEGATPTGASPAPEGEEQSLIDIAREAVASLPPEERSGAGSPPAEEGQQTPEGGAPSTEQPPADAGASAAGSEEQQQGDAREGEGEAQDPDDYSDILGSDDVPGKTKRRVQDLLRERSELREQVALSSEQTESYRADAEQYQQVQQFMQANQLTPAETAETLQVAALIRNDPFQAVGVLEKYVERLKAATGGTIPAELQAKVAAGHLSQADAIALSTARARARHAEQVTHEQSERHAADQAQAQRQVMSQAVNQWESQIRTTDPDYGVKRPFILDRLRASLAADGLPADMMDAVNRVNQIHAAVTKQLGAIRPAPRTPTPPAPRGERTTTGSRPEPTTLLDAAKQSLDAFHATQ